MDQSCHIWMSHGNESCHIWGTLGKYSLPRLSVFCHIWMSLVTYGWVMSLLGISHVTCECVTSLINESCHMCMSHVTDEWDTSNMQHTSNESWDTSRKYAYVTYSLCRTYEWVVSQCTISRIWMSHVTFERDTSHMWHTRHLFTASSLCVMSHTNESYHVWMSHVIHRNGVTLYRNASCHVWTSHVTHMDESCHVWKRHVTYVANLAPIHRLISVRHVTNMDQSCQTYAGVIHPKLR